MREEVIITELVIKKFGERKYFQVSLPLDTERIIGVELGHFADAGIYIPALSPYPDTVPANFVIHASPVAGQLTLSSMGAENMFYQGELVMEDYHPAFGQVANPFFAENTSSHGKKKEPLSVNVSGNSPIVEGYYKDNWGGAGSGPVSGDVNYTIHIYIWIEKKIDS